MTFGMQPMSRNINTMEIKKVTFNSQTYNPVKAFFYAFPIYVIFVGIAIVISMQLHKPIIGIVGWIIISSVPFVFQKRFKYAFTKDIELILDNQSFIINEYKTTRGKLINEIIIKWAEIKTYKCSFSSGTTYLTISLRDGSTKNLSFKEEKTQVQIINEKSVFSIFNYYIYQYNFEEKGEDAIILIPSFLATKWGAFLLYGLTALAIAAIITHILVAPKSSMISFMSFFIIMGLVAKRKTDKDLYNKINQLQPKINLD